MNELALFAGAGLGILGGKLLGWRTICYVENNPYCVSVLTARIKDGYLDDAPIWDDVRTFDGYPWAGSVDIVTAGFPCQPWSNAGKMLGEHDDRNLWPDTIRVIREVKPNYCLLENVTGLLSRLYIQQIFGDLAEVGYDARWGCISAAAIGAPHLRNRLWILAYSNGGRYKNLQSLPEQSDFSRFCETISDPNGEQGGLLQGKEREIDTEIIRCCQNVSNPSCIGLEKQDNQSDERQFNKTDWWQAEPELGRVVDGCPNRVDRLKAIGNGQVPAVVRAAWELLNAGTARRWS